LPNITYAYNKHGVQDTQEVRKKIRKNIFRVDRLMPNIGINLHLMNRMVVQQFLKTAHCRLTSKIFLAINFRLFPVTLWQFDFNPLWTAWGEF
jgi:hypothetical protein